MVTIEQIKPGNTFTTDSGIVWIIDSISQDNLVRTSMKDGAKGYYRDDINECLEFLNEQNAYLNTTK